PDGEHDTIIRAAASVVQEGIAKPMLLGRPDWIRDRAKSLHIDLEGVELMHP
ncbi:MAG: phosphate acetyltransferase, partial [Gemmatimonadetes bacterium]|nr:phosphate acetyltransferase [Gemmatimonadota bacterium]NIR75444.1 phosphate acetyltransferase [Candidatus Kutchimonas denitrificans]NIU75338.1 phosphate acetyltransferase [Gammaproteobacteria bacterium]NIS01023.1 phosphate acetyltransferase [Gemmatimonadota bacterium]NIV23173.1 phosphate acetyltransferase [Gemmatimonadota bacterium]